MYRKSFLFISFLMVVIILSACQPQPDMPNPASVYCEENGGKLEIRTDEETGGQVGYCIFPDGSECEEWAYFRGECKQGDSLSDIADMPNPASVYCEENSGTVDIRTDEETGGQVGICVFPDGSECDEWAYFRGECEPGDSLSQEIGMPNPASVYCEEQGGTLEIREDSEGQVGYCRFADNSLCEEWAFFRGECLAGGIYPVETFADDGWKVYQNEKLGYSFHFPPEAIIISNEDPMKTVTIQGPLVDDENWPMIFFNHPNDLPEYVIPEGEDLEDWLTEANLLHDDRLDDRVIAGEQAIHLRQNTGEQAFPFDQYFFMKDGQLYSVVILHTGNQEDWKMYNQFLDSIQFD
jgi:putative hemolysin